MAENIDKKTELQDPSRPERIRNIVAVAVSLGTKPKVALDFAKEVLRESQKPNLPDYKKDYHDQNPEDAATIERFGKKILAGSERRDQMCFTIGARVLSLAKESPDSGYFTNLPDWVGYWTDGDITQKMFEKFKKEVKV